MVFFLRTERNIRLLFLIAIAVFAYAAKHDASTQDWALLIIAVVMVLTAEMLNSALEYTLDLLHPERHPLVKAAKDIAAGAVLLTCLGAFAIGVLVFFG